MPSPRPRAIAASGIAALSDGTFAKIAKLVLSSSGIHLTPSKRVLVESRLQARLREIGLDSFEAYVEGLERGGLPPGEEVRLVESMTTHKTDFFREPKHFEQLDRFLRAESKKGRRRVEVWSAACSSGAEPYSMAICLAELVKERSINHFSVLATDISNRVLNAARTAVYSEEEVGPISLPLRQSYLLRAKDPKRKLVKIRPELRSQVQFQQANLTQPRPVSKTGFDAIFCRNVLIYFEAETQRRVARCLLNYLRPGGLLFLGHAESGAAQDLQVPQIAPTIYQRPAEG